MYDPEGIYLALLNLKSNQNDKLEKNIQ
jgi:hypothetical protein